VQCYSFRNEGKVIGRYLWCFICMSISIGPSSSVERLIFWFKNVIIVVVSILVLWVPFKPSVVSLLSFEWGKIFMITAVVATFRRVSVVIISSTWVSVFPFGIERLGLGVRVRVRVRVRGLGFKV
jgi:hypothetical protein